MKKSIFATQRIGTSVYDEIDLPVHREFPEYIYRFSLSAISDLIEGEQAFDLNVGSRLYDTGSEDFHAFVSLLPSLRKLPRYRISLCGGLMDGLNDAIQSLSKHDPDNEITNSPAMAELNAKTTNDVFVWVYLFSVTFVVFHELSHIFAGHLDYLENRRRQKSSLYGKLRSVPIVVSETRGVGTGSMAGSGFSEYIEKDLSPLPGWTLSRLMELEADGTAVELLAEYQSEIASMTVENFPEVTELSESGRCALAQIMLAGALLVIVLLEDRSVRTTEEETGYPFPGARLLNLCTTYLEWLLRSRAGVRIAQDRHEVVMDILQAEVFPSLLLVQAIVKSLGQGNALLGTGLGEILFVDDNDFVTDLVSLLSGDKAGATPGGREMTELQVYYKSYLVELESFRKTGWWDHDSRV